MHRRKKGSALLSAIIVGSFAIAAVIMGFAANITDGALGNIDPAGDEVESVLRDLDRSCSLGTETRETFEPEGSERGNSGNSELEVCQDNQQLCYGDQQISLQDLSCESIQMDGDCDSIQSGSVYTTTSEGDKGVLGCE